MAAILSGVGHSPVLYALLAAINMGLIAAVDFTAAGALFRIWPRRKWGLLALCGAMLIIDVFGILWGVGGKDGMMFPGVIAMGFLLIVNLILAFVFKADYRIISFWINGYLLVSFCVTFGYSRKEGEGVPALISVLEFLLTIGSIIAVAKVI